MRLDINADSSELHYGEVSERRIDIVSYFPTEYLSKYVVLNECRVRLVKNPPEIMSPR